MFSVRGIYENGQVTLLEPIPETRRASVIITILDEQSEPEKKMDVSVFRQLMGVLEERTDCSSDHDRYLMKEVHS